MDDPRQTNHRLKTTLSGGERTARHASWCVLWVCAVGFAMVSTSATAETTKDSPNQPQSSPRIASSGLLQPQFVAPEGMQQVPVTASLPSPSAPGVKAPYGEDSVIIEDTPSKEAEPGRSGIWQMLFGSNSSSGTGSKASGQGHSTTQTTPRRASGTSNILNSAASNTPAKANPTPAPVAGSLFGQMLGNSKPSQPAVAPPSNNTNNNSSSKPKGIKSAGASLAAAGTPTTTPSQTKPSAASAAPATDSKSNVSASVASMQPEVLRTTIAPQTPPIAEGANKLWQQLAPGNNAPSPASIAAANAQQSTHQSQQPIAGQPQASPSKVAQSAAAPNAGAATSSVIPAQYLPGNSATYPLSNIASNAPAPQDASKVGSTPSPAASAAAIQPGAIFAPVAKVVSDVKVESSASSGLWRSLSMNQNGSVPQAAAANSAAPAAPQSAAVNQVAANSNQTIRTPGSTSPTPTNVESSIWMQPFYLTNGTPAAANSGEQSAAGLTTNSRQGDLETGLQSSSLLRQLSMSNGNEPPATADGSPNSRYSAEQAAYNKAAASGELTDAALSAYMQDLEPEPADLDVKTGGEPAPAAAGKEGEAKKEEGALSGAEKLGKKPEDNTLEFLRAETVLLKPGESQFDIGLTYLITENDFPILLANSNQTISGVDKVNFRSRQLVMPMEYRTGLTKRVQGFLGVPIGWANTQLNFNGVEGYFNDGGLGDVTFGLTAQLVDATPDCPYVIGTLSSTAPTGSDPFTGVAAFATSAPSLGQGFWSVQGQMLCIQEYDPCVVFYGGGIQGFFPHEYVGREFRRGLEYSYLFGIGFAVNERITLSSRFRGAYVDDLEIDGQRVLGSNLEPMTLRFAATISKPCKRLVEPFVEFGLTDESVNSYFGINWTF